MNTETKENSNVEDNTITQDSMEDVEVDFTIEENDDENQEQNTKDDANKS